MVEIEVSVVGVVEMVVVRRKWLDLVRDNCGRLS